MSDPLSSPRFNPKGYVVPKVKEIDPSGLTAVKIGTAMWFIAAIAMLPFWGTLANHGLLWMFWTCLAGVGMGIFGYEYCRRQHRN